MGEINQRSLNYVHPCKEVEEKKKGKTKREREREREREKTEEETKEGKKELVVFNPGTVSLFF